MVQIRCKGTTKIVIFNGKTNQRDGKIVKFANYFGFLKKKNTIFACNFCQI